MPMIQKPIEPLKKEQVRVRLEKNILTEIIAYCEWADISQDYFIEQSALVVFDRDKEWKEKKQKKTAESAQ